MNERYSRPLLQRHFAFYTICSNHKNRRLNNPQIAMSQLKPRLSDLELRLVNGVIVGFEPEPVALSASVSVSVVPPMTVPPITTPLAIVPPTVVTATVVPPTVVPPTTVIITADPADSIGGAPGTPEMPVVGEGAGIGLTGCEGPNKRDDTTAGGEIMGADTDGFGPDKSLEAIWLFVGGANIAVDEVSGGTDVSPTPVEGRIVLVAATVVVTAGILMIFVVVKIITGDA